MQTYESTVSLSQAARMLGMTPQGVWKHVHQGNLPTVQIEGKPRIPKEALSNGFLTKRGPAAIENAFAKVARRVAEGTRGRLLAYPELMGEFVTAILSDETLKTDINAAIRRA